MINYNNPYQYYGTPQYQQTQYMPRNNMINMGLQGKMVDSLEVVRATDIPYDREYKFLSANRW